MISQSCLYACPMEPWVPNGMNADYQPQILVCYNSPTETDMTFRHYAKHQIFTKSHTMHPLKGAGGRDYELWIQN